MQLIVYIGRLCLLLHKRQDILQLTLVARLKSRRIVEDKPGVALECKRTIDIMFPSLIRIRSDTLVIVYIKWNTPGVGSS